jgi:hypothetical protein
MRRTLLTGTRSSTVERVESYTGGSQRRAGVRRFAAVAGAALAFVAIAGAPGAQAAGQEHERFHDVFTDVDPDFCGTGQEIDIAFDVWVNAFHAPKHALYQETARGKVTFTNPLTGDTVINRFAGRTKVVLVSGDPEGVHEVLVTVTGLPELLKASGGGVLIRDAGFVLLRQTYDGEEFISSEVVVVHGPHPDLESDFELFCEVMPEALGIES